MVIAKRHNCRLIAGMVFGLAGLHALHGSDPLTESSFGVKYEWQSVSSMLGSSGGRLRIDADQVRGIIADEFSISSNLHSLTIQGDAAISFDEIRRLALRLDRVGSLSIRRCAINSLPVEVQDIQGLIHLEIIDAPMVEIDPIIRNLSGLERLVIGLTQIESVDWDTLPETVHTIVFASNNIERVEGDIARLSNLKSISLANNRIVDFAVQSSVGTASVAALDLDRNPIQGPLDLSNLTNLGILSLNDCSLESLPSILLAPDTQVRVTLFRNPLKSLSGMEDWVRKPAELALDYDLLGWLRIVEIEISPDAGNLYKLVPLDLTGER